MAWSLHVEGHSIHFYKDEDCLAGYHGSANEDDPDLPETNDVLTSNGRNPAERSGECGDWLLTLKVAAANNEYKLQNHATEDRDLDKQESK